VYRVFLLLVGILAVSEPLLAHHGNTWHDNKVLTLHGAVTEWLWINPHVFLKVGVKDDNGKVNRPHTTDLRKF
jgi:hypothetical protein